MLVNEELLPISDDSIPATIIQTKSLMDLVPHDTDTFITKLTSNLNVIKQETNEKLSHSTTKQELIPVVFDFISSLIQNSQEQIAGEKDSNHECVSLLNVTMSSDVMCDSPSSRICGFKNFPIIGESDCDVYGIERYELLNENYKKQLQGNRHIGVPLLNLGIINAF